VKRKNNKGKEEDSEDKNNQYVIKTSVAVTVSELC